MVDLWVQFVFAWWILFPAYAANLFPPFAKGKLPIDLGAKLVRHRLLGESKTMEGFALGVLAGTAVGALETVVAPQLNLFAAQYGVQLPYMDFFVGFMIAFGAMCGDVAGSFLKRRLGMKNGSNAPLLDQLNFIAGAVFFSFLFTEISVWMIAFMLIMTPIIHRLSCMIGYKLKVKKVPW